MFYQTNNVLWISRWKLLKKYLGLHVEVKIAYICTHSVHFQPFLPNSEERVHKQISYKGEMGSYKSSWMGRTGIFLVLLETLTTQTLPFLIHLINKIFNHYSSFVWFFGKKLWRNAFLGKYGGKYMPLDAAPLGPFVLWKLIDISCSVHM